MVPGKSSFQILGKDSTFIVGAFLTRLVPRLRCLRCVDVCTVGMCEVGMCKVGICKGASRTIKGLTGELLPLVVSPTLKPEDNMEGV